VDNNDTKIQTCSDILIYKVTGSAGYIRYWKLHWKSSETWKD